MSKRDRRTKKALKRIGKRERGGKLKRLDGGEPCRKCGQPMQRLSHGDDWSPKPQQPYYFSFWDRCFGCRHLQHYEAAKVFIDWGPEGEVLRWRNASGDSPVTDHH